MFPYWILFTIFAAGSLEYRRRAAVGSEATPLLAVAGLFVALMIGFRFEVGGDWLNYVSIFEEINYSGVGVLIRAQDPGYTFVNWLVGRIGAEIWLVNLICGLIFSWGLVKFARRQPNPWLAALIAVPYLIIVVAMGYTRQGVAIGFILAGLAVVERTTILRFVIYIFLAAIFHKSAIIVLPLVALAATRRRILIVPLLGATAILLYYLFVSESIDRMVVNYVDQEYQSEGAAIRVAMNLPPALLFLLFNRRFALDEQQRKLWRNFAYAALAALLLLVVSASSTVVDRLALYLIPLQMFVLARLPEAFSARGRSSGALVLLVIGYSALIQFVWLNFATHAEFWVPYQVYPLTEQ